MVEQQAAQRLGNQLVGFKDPSTDGAASSRRPPKDVLHIPTAVSDAFSRYGTKILPYYEPVINNLTVCFFSVNPRVSRLKDPTQKTHRRLHPLLSVKRLPSPRLHPFLSPNPTSRLHLKLLVATNQPSQAV